jgi:hypothetical protein
MTVTSIPAVDVLDPARSKLAEYLDVRHGETLRRLRTLRTYPKPFSVTIYLEAETDAGSHRFVMKQVLDHPENAYLGGEANRAVVEFDVLTRLYPRFERIEHCSVPRPVAVMPAIGAFLMELVEGHLMEEELKFAHYFAARAGYRTLQTHFYHCARWLKHMQQITGNRRAGVEGLEGVLERSEDRLRLIEESGDPRCPKDFRRRATDLLHRQVERLADREIIVTGRHGDFGPWNVLADGEGITVVDFYCFREDPLPVDPLRMLLHLESCGMNPANSPRRVARFRERFLAGFGPLPRVPRPLVTLCEALHRICRVFTAVTRQQSRLARRIQVRRCLRVDLDWLLDREPKPRLWPEDRCA